MENSINFLNSLGINHIIINSHHLHKDIISFVKKKKFNPRINVVVEKGKILNTGGGVLNASKKWKTSRVCSRGVLLENYDYSLPLFKKIIFGL